MENKFLKVGWTVGLPNKKMAIIGEVDKKNGLYLCVLRNGERISKKIDEIELLSTESLF